MWGQFWGGVAAASCQHVISKDYQDPDAAVNILTVDMLTVVNILYQRINRTSRYSGLQLTAGRLVMGRALGDTEALW